MQLIILIVGLLLSFLFIGIHLNQLSKTGIYSLYTKFLVTFIIMLSVLLISSSKIQGSYNYTYEISLILSSLLCLNFASILSHLGKKYEFHLKQHLIASQSFYLVGFILLGLSSVLILNNRIEFSLINNLIYVGSFILGSLIISLIFTFTTKQKIQTNLINFAFALTFLIFSLAFSIFLLIKTKVFFTFFLILACLILLINKLSALFKINKNETSFVTTKDFLLYLSQILICLYIYFI